MSLSMMGCHAWSRFRVSSACTAASSRGTLAGRIIGDWSLPAQRAEITAAIKRSTPRVRWNPSRVDQSSYSRAKSSGWIGYERLDLVDVSRLPALARELRRLRSVELAEGLRGGVAISDAVGRDGLEESPANDLEALFCRRWPPGRFGPSDDVAEPTSCFLPSYAT